MDAKHHAYIAELHRGYATGEYSHPTRSREENRLDNPAKKPASETQVGGGHYTSMQIQPTYFCQVNRLNSCESQAIGYICRHQSKNGRQDIEKAIHCLELLLEWEYGDE